MWRITDDFWDEWPLLYAMFERAEKWSAHAGAGHYPDADMLPIGPIRQDADRGNRTAFTQDEQRTMMTLWSIMRSPLMIGGEMTGFDAFTMGLITNEGILRMHRNARGAAAGDPGTVTRLTDASVSIYSILTTNGHYGTNYSGTDL